MTSLYKTDFFAGATQTSFLRACAACVLAFAVAGGPAFGADAAHGGDAHSPAAPKAAAAAPAPRASAPVSAKQMGDQVREALESGVVGNQRLNLSAPRPAPARTAAPAAADHSMPSVPGRLENPATSRQLIRARAAALAASEPLASAHGGGAVHWSYEGENGPQAWGTLKPEFNVCAIGKRQSPINIEENNTLQGPAEPVQFNYQPSSGSVVNNGHTIQVDIVGDNSITVRGSVYKLLQFHFHHPSEEQVNYRNFSMVAHLVHRNAEGQLAVVAVLLDTGVLNPLINKVWTHMPLDAGDRVRLPPDLLNMNELLPTDQRYYQFMGSLTTPPCTENVLWLVLKTPMAISREQLRLFSQLFPNNARPVQPVNGRPVRNAQ